MKTLRWLNLVALLFMLVLNGLANALPINGLNTGEVSARYPALFTPAGYVFSIWGIIYLGLILLVVYQFVGKGGEAVAQRMGPWFAVSSLINGVWILAWHYLALTLSVLLMLALLASLIRVYEGLGIGRTDAGPAERWLVRVPISIYLGWISVATIANITGQLYHISWQGWGLSPVAWTVLMVVVAAVLNGLMILRRREVAFPLVFVWAAVGIAVANRPGGAVAIAALIAAALVAVAIIAAAWTRLPGRRSVT